jgi:hypothetical protein
VIQKTKSLLPDHSDQGGLELLNIPVFVLVFDDDGIEAGVLPLDSITALPAVLRHYLLLLVLHVVAGRLLDITVFEKEGPKDRKIPKGVNVD